MSYGSLRGLPAIALALAGAKRRGNPNGIHGEVGDCR